MTPFIEALRSKKYEWEIPDDFQDSFFRDRHLVVEETTAFAKRNEGRTDGNLTILDGGVLLWGASTIEENYLLDQLVAQAKAKVVVEIGLYRGQTALTPARALKKYSPSGRYFGFDISEASVEITNRLLQREGLGKMSKIHLSGFNPILLEGLAPDFVLIDGDHSFEGAARDLVASYNELAADGVIAMHDIGAPNWGFTKQDPGVLFHDVFPQCAGENARVSFLDSMCRDLTMRMLCPTAKTRHKYFDTYQRATEIAAATMKDTVLGWGGMGVIQKVNAAHKLELEKVIALRPPAIGAPSEGKKPRKSIVSRMLRKASELIP